MFKSLKSKLSDQKIGKVFLCRHGATLLNGDTNSSDRVRGWIDVPLNNKGRLDADKAGEKLSKEHPSVIYTSDLERAVETAEIIDRRFHSPIQKSTDLRPWGLGDFQGKQTKDVLPEMKKLVESDTTPAPGGGESFKRFRTRYLSYLERIMQQAISEGKTVFVVCHFRNLITYDGWKEQGYPSDFSVDTSTVLGDKFKTGEICEVDLEEYLKKRGSNG